MISYDTNTGKTTYSDGDSLSRDLREKVRDGDKDALQKLKDFAANRDPEQPHSQARALYELAEVYFNGLCEVERSPQEALKLLIQAAELDDDLASLRLAKFYRDGKQGFKQNGQKALELMKKESFDILFKSSIILLNSANLLSCCTQKYGFLGYVC